MLPRYSQHVAGYKQHVAGQHVTCIRQQVARPSNMLPGNMLPWCKRGLRQQVRSIKYSRTPKYDLCRFVLRDFSPLHNV